MTLVLAIDVGTSSVKVQLSGTTGTLVAEASRPYPTNRPHPGHAEQEPEDWWRATAEAVRLTLGRGGSSGGDVAAIGITGQMHGTVLVDGDHRPLSPAIIWSDQRAVAEVAALEGRPGLETIIATTGGRLATGYQAVTVSWLASHRPDLLASCRTVLLPKDWLRARLTGVVATEPSDAGGTALFDIRRREWSPMMLAAAGLRPEQLPPVLASTERAGNLTAEAADALGLAPEIPVATGAGDAQAAALGAGVTSPGDLLVTLSTGTQALIPVSAVPAIPDYRGQTVCSALEPAQGPGWARVAATLNCGSALHWAAAALGFPDDRALLAAAAHVPAGSRGVLFVPYLAGERAPWHDAGARGTFLGLAADHGRDDLARAVVEGVTLAASLAYSAIAPASRRVPRFITLAGGGARDATWRQIVADVYGLPVRYSATPDQSARGAAILATAMLNGANPADVAAARQPASLAETSPDPERHDLYQERQALLADAYLALRPIVGRLAVRRGSTKAATVP